MKTKLTFLLLIVLVFASCKKEIDTDNPVVTVDEPSNGGAVYTNDGLRLVATLTDNTGLLQYKLTLNGIDSLNDVGADSTISMIFVEGIPDKNKAFYIDEVIPLHDSIFNGHYQMTLACIDVEGNESLRDTVNFEIRNSNDYQPPVFDIASVNQHDTLGLGQGFGVEGMLYDENLIYSDFHVGTVSGNQTIFYQEFPVIIDNTIEYTGIGWWFQVDSTWSQGDYRVYVTAWDNYSGVSYEIPFYVSY